jgi:hypothetical protein
MVPELNPRNEVHRKHVEGVTELIGQKSWVVAQNRD